MAGYDSGTDSDTVSSSGEGPYDDSDIQHMPEPERTAHLFWAHEHAKARWRRHNDHP